MSNRSAIVAVLVALLSLAYFLFAVGESTSTVIPVDELVISGDEKQAVATWQLPESLRRIADSKTPRRDASFLFYRQRLVPLDFPFDVVDAPTRQATGWHRVRDGVLEFSLPTSQSIKSLQADDLVFELNGPMSVSRELAWTVLMSTFFVMATIRSPLSKALLSARWLVIFAWLMPVVVIASFITTLYFPLPLRWQTTILGMAFDRFDAVLPGLILLYAVCGWVNDRFAKERDENVPSFERSVRSGSIAAITLLMLSFVRLMSWGPGETAVWSPVETSSPFASSIAFSDAEGYLAGVYRLLTTGTLDQWNQRRPINATLLATRIAISHGNIDVAKWLQAIAMAMGIAWLASEVARTYGWRSTVAAVALLVGCGRLFLITTLSEPLGFTLGCLAMVGLLRQLRTGCFVSGLAGLGLMAIAQGARPGALFVLPAIGLWVACVASRDRDGNNRWRRRALAFGITGLIGGLTLAVNPMLSRIYGTSENLTGSNFAHTFLGLAVGKSWDQAVQDYQSQIDQQPNEKAVALFLYQEGLRQIGRQPQVFVGQMAKSLVQFAVETPRFLTAITARSTADSLFPLMWFQLLALMILVALATWRTVGLRWIAQLHFRGELWLWLLIACGIACSIPFVFLDGGLRVLIATWPAVLIWIASSLASPQSDLASTGIADHKNDHSSRWWLVGLLSGVVMTAAIGPMLLRHLIGFSSTSEVMGNPKDSFLLDRRFMGPQVWIGNDAERAWSSTREMSNTDWMRFWQRSGIGLYGSLATLWPNDLGVMERALFVQVFSPGDDRTRTLMVPEPVASDWLETERAIEVEVRWSEDWPLAGRVVGGPSFEPQSRSRTK